MSAAESQSARQPGRVVSHPTIGAGGRRLSTVRAPEGRPGLGSPPSSPEGRRRVSRRGLAAIAEGLSERDRAILGDLAGFHFLTTRQVEVLHFDGHPTPTTGARLARRSLARLHRLGVITHLGRRIGGVRAGSASFVWRVGTVGDRLLRADAGAVPRQRRKEPSERHLAHVLAVADVYVQLVTASRAGRLELVGYKPEPVCWRRYLGAGGHREVLKPDLALTTAIGEYEDDWSVEVDRATESLPTLLRKCRQYEQYRRSGHEQATRGVFPRVVWVLPDEPRRVRLADALRHARDLPQGLFRLCVAEGLVAVLARGAA